MFVCLALFEQFVLKLVEIAFQFECPAATTQIIMDKQFGNYWSERESEKKRERITVEQRRILLGKLLLKRAKITKQSCLLIPAYCAHKRYDEDDEHGA